MHICIVCWNAAPSPLPRCPRCNSPQQQCQWPELPWYLPGHKHLTLQSFHSAGGQGVVYRATDSALGKEVAVKLLARHLSREAYEDEIDRFAREKAAMDFISHAASLPMFVDVYDFHRGSQEPQLDQAPAFLEMEFIQWPTLGSVIKSAGKLPANTVFLIALELAQALRIMSRRIIHNDIKPDNLFVNIKKDKVELKVADFGIWVPDDDKVVTQVGAGHGIAGTIAYMSPEQSSGDRWDSRSDIYAACCVTWRCCTGNRPFPKTASDLPLLDQLKERRKLTRTFPPRPDSMPPELYDVLRKGLQHDRHERHKDANDFRTHLQDAYRDWRTRIDEERRASLAKLETYAAAIADQRQKLSAYYQAYVELSGYTSGVEDEIGRLRDEQEGAFDPEEEPLDIPRVKTAIDNARSLLGDERDDESAAKSKAPVDEPEDDGDSDSGVSERKSTLRDKEPDDSTKKVSHQAIAAKEPAQGKTKSKPGSPAQDKSAKSEPGKPTKSEQGKPAARSSKDDEGKTPIAEPTAAVDDDESEPTSGGLGSYAPAIIVVLAVAVGAWYFLVGNKGAEPEPARSGKGLYTKQRSGEPSPRNAEAGAAGDAGADAGAGADVAAVDASAGSGAAEPAAIAAQGSSTGSDVASGVDTGPGSDGAGTSADADAATGTTAEAAAATTSGASPDAPSGPEARKAQWLESPLSAGEQRDAYKKKARIQTRSDGSYRLSFKGTTCGLQFGDDGNPERLKGCKNTGQDDWTYLSNTIRLKCKADRCSGRYEWFDNGAGGEDAIWLRIKKPDEGASP